MNNVLINRFLSETSKINLNENVKKLIELKEEKESVFKNNSEIINPDDLKEKILKKLESKPKIIMTESKDFPFEKDLVHFSSLEEFISWYEKNRNSFSENQRKPLDTLVEARNMTVGGCNCNLQQRKNVANGYFHDFWVNNKHTDLIPTLQKILKTKKIIFGDFLTYPS